MSLERYGGGAACPTGKKIFVTRRQAKRWIKRRPKGNHRRAYPCHDCSYFHVSSYDANSTRLVREEIRDDI